VRDEVGHGFFGMAERRTRTRPRILRVLAAVLCITMPACYSYVPVASRTPTQGAMLGMSLSEPVDVRLAGLTANDVVQLRGELIRMDASEVAVSATWLRSRNTFEFPGAGETVTVPRSSIIEITEKRFSFAKTGLFTAAILGVALLIQGAFHPLGGGGSNGGGGPIQ